MNRFDNSDSCMEEAPSDGSIMIPRWKRVLDITLVLMALPLVLPVMLLVAIMIRMVSTGPILFKQERIGHLGKRFRCFKFRSMSVGNDTAIHQGHLSRLMDSDVPLVK